MVPDHKPELDCPPPGRESSWLEDAVKRFEHAWRLQPRPMIEDFLPAGDRRQRVLVELVHIDLELRLKAGEAARAEEYLDRYPELAGDRSAALELIAFEYQLRRRGEPGLVLDDYLQRFPQYREVLPEQIDKATLVVSDSPRRPADLQAPLEVAGYEILEVLGRGGMGVVYKARQCALNRIVALKMILTAEHAEPSEVSRFRREAEMVARLQCPHIVQIYEIGEQEGRHFFAMEFIEGGSLDRQLGGTPQPARAAARLVETLARTMHYAHQHDIIHRDLKPANILLQTMKGTEATATKASAGDLSSSVCSVASAVSFIPKITDFGVAKLLRDAEASPTQSGDVLGTPSYMAPEQADGKPAPIGPAADVYGLGSILYELLTGRPPFKAETPLETLLQVKFTDPVSPSQLQPRLSRDLVTICLHCLEKEPRKRYASALALAEDLHRFLVGRPIQARPVGLLVRTVKWARRRPAVAVLGAGICLALALGFAGVTWQWREAEGARRTAEDRLYFNRIALAHQAWRGYQVGQADRLLNECLPIGGQHDRRSWEWHYLRRLCHAAQLTLPEHALSVNGVAFSPDGCLLASCTGGWLGEQPSDVLVWDAFTGKLLHTFRGHERSVFNVAFAPDGRLLASASYDKTLRLWDLTHPENAAAVLTDAETVLNVAFSPDGRLLAATYALGSVRIWDVKSRTELGNYKKHPDNVFAVAFNPTGRKIATGGRNDKAVQIWDPDTGRDLGSLPWEIDIRGVAFSPDGTLLAAAGYWGAVKVWDLSKPGAEATTHHLYAGSVLNLAISPNNRDLAWCTITGRIQLIDARTGAEVRTFRGHDGPVNSLAFSPDGRCLASAGADRLVRVWSVDAPQEVQSHLLQGGWNYDCAFSPDDKYLALAGGINHSRPVAEHKSVRLWDVDAKRLAKEFQWNDYLTSVAYGRDQLAGGSEDGTAVIWDVATAAVRHELKAHRGVVTAIAYSPDARYLATVGEDGTLRFWDTGTGQESYTVPGDGTALMCVAYSPDGRLVAASGEDQAIHLWDAATGREVHTLLGHEATVTCVAFTPDGKRLASGDLDQVVRLWDVRTAKEETPHNDPIRLNNPALVKKRKTWGRDRPWWFPRIAFSADGRRLASINGRRPVQLWDVATRLEVLTLPVQESGFQCVAFSRNGRWLVAVAGVWLHVWDAGPSDVTPAPDGR
jgi:WD40 repeat protein/serine/threonine protein kinase